MAIEITVLQATLPPWLELPALATKRAKRGSIASDDSTEVDSVRAAVFSRLSSPVACVPSFPRRMHSVASGT